MNYKDNSWKDRTEPDKIAKANIPELFSLFSEGIDKLCPPIILDQEAIVLSDDAIWSKIIDAYDKKNKLGKYKDE